MLLPTKNIKLSDSILGLSALIVNNLSEKSSLDNLWIKVNISFNTTNYPAIHTYNNFLLAIDYLYSIGVLELDQSGDIHICD